MKFSLRFLALLLLLSTLFTACGIVDTPFEDGEIEGDGGWNDTTAGGDKTHLKNNTVWINEVCSKSSNADMGGFDWIELYNSGAKDVDISGWRLTDTKKELGRYVFPENTIIGSGEYMLIWASGGVAPDASLPYAKYFTSFRISNDGETLYLMNPDGLFADIVTVPGMAKDQSWGRSEDGKEIFATLSGTPSDTNEGSVVLLSSDVITFSHESGFYSDAFYLNMEVPKGFSIYYTTDCSDPRGQDAISYTGPVKVTDPSGVPTHSYSYFEGRNTNLEYVDKCFVVRAVAVDENGVYTKEVTKEYFVNYETKDGYLTEDKSSIHLPIVTLTTDPNEIYSRDNGLFPNYNLEKLEKQVSISYFDTAGELVFSQQAGIRIRGSSTRNAFQKNLNVYARSEYDGNSIFPDELFPDAAFTKSFVLRSDNRWNLQLGQGILQDIVADRSIVTQDSFPVIVFLDGEYFGIYSLYERVSEDFIEAHYDVDDKEAWIVKFGREENTQGALADYQEMLNLLSKGDLTKDTVWNQVLGRIDMQSLIDLFCIHMWYDNGDFLFSSGHSQNVSAWRASPAALDSSNPYADGKWRFVFFDLDYALDGPAQTGNAWLRDTFTVTPKNAAIGAPFLKWDTVQNLMKRKEFVTMFRDTFLELADINFHYEENVKGVMEAHIELLYPCVLPYLERFNYKSSSGSVRGASSWSSRLREKEVDFMKYRYDTIVPKMQEHFVLK